MISLQAEDISKNSICKNTRKNYCKVCKKETKQIPVRKIDSFIIVEEYCPWCDESTLRYEKILSIE